MKLLVLLLLTTSSHSWEVSSTLRSEFTAYPERGLYLPSSRFDTSFSLETEFTRSWEEGRKVVSFLPYFRYSTTDTERSLVDIREASFVGSWDQWELRLGISKVFWGVTESVHLVDVINQTDLSFNPDGEAKLGQLMFNPTLVTENGNYSFFWLPHFRERRFSGPWGRFRLPLNLEDKAIYGNNNERRHSDFAFRYSHYIENLDFAVSYFQGTDREPQMNLTAQGSFQAHYNQVRQLGVELQYIDEAWLYKFEGVHKDRDFASDYSSFAIGFEYTKTNIHLGRDLGYLLEYLYDSRYGGAESPFGRHLFAGARYVYNDTQDSQILAGVFLNADDMRADSLRIEASTRIGENAKLELEIQSIIDPESNSPVNNFKKDNYVKVSYNWYF